MKSKLFTLIKDEVYESTLIKEASFNSQEKETTWIFDFKSQGLSKVFLQEYSQHFWDIFENKYGTKIQIGGMETGAISLVTGVALLAPENVTVSSFYIRKSRKKSDLANLVEGELKKDIPLILVDDILNGGTTINKQAVILEGMGYKVSAVFVCLRFRDISYYKDLTDKGIEIFSIFELNDFSNVLPVKNLVTETALPVVRKFSVEYKVILTKKPNLYTVIAKSAPILCGEYIYMAVDDGTFFCLTAKDGVTVWKYKVYFGAKGKRIFSSPQIYKDSIIFGAYDGNVFCLNRFTGKREWIFSDADWVGSSPCINEQDGIVYIGLEFGLPQKKGGVVAIDIQTGKAIWKNYEMTGYTHATPAYSRKYNLVVCGCNDHYVYGFNAKNGSIIWKFKTEGEFKSSAVFDEKRSVVIIAGMDGGVYVLNTKNGELHHKFEARFGFYSTALVRDGLIFIGSLDKVIYCFNIDEKVAKWIFETNGRIFSSPVISENSLFIGSNDGMVYELNVNTGKCINTLQFGERIVNKIQVEVPTNKKRILYVPTHVGELYKVVEL